MTRQHTNEAQIPQAKMFPPFDPPERRRTAVKVVTTIGMEMTAVREIAR